MAFFFKMNTIRVILINVLALPSFIMAVDCNQNIEAQKSASIRHNGTPHGLGGLIKILLKQVNEFV